MSEITVIAVENRNDWRDFLRLPRAIYRQDPVHVLKLETLVKEELDP